MAAGFFFYDLETSGLAAATSRIMQFAGQRTDLALQPVGEPVNVLIKMSDDTLPDPDAVLVTGITPQQTVAEGLTEAEFLRFFTDEVATPGTIFAGYNTVRFDDEFMRYLHYRNFYDPYEWQWQDQRSRWDLLDVVRMTRALRPEGIEWAFDAKGNPTNRLELLTALNKLEHEHAHDALSDVWATIAVAQLIRTKHRKLFDFLLTLRDKRKAAELAGGGQPFVYTSGRYPSEFEKTTVAYTVCGHPARQGAFVYDLRHDPAAYQAMTPEQLAEKWRWKKDAEEPRLPVKTLQYNKCPAIAPLSVLDAASQARLKLDMVRIKKHLQTLQAMPDFAERLCRAWEVLETKQQTSLVSTSQDADTQLYQGFFGNQDKQAMRLVRAAAPDEVAELAPHLSDQRLQALLPLYKARNYPKTLTGEDREQWERFRAQKLAAGGQQSRLAKYFGRLQDIAARGNLTSHQEYLLEELKLWAESIVPSPDGL